MSRKIAVIITERQEEALRMSIGLTLMDDVVDIYVLNRKLEGSKSLAANLETIQDLELNMYSNYADQTYAEHVSIDHIADSIADYDHVLPY